MSPCSARSRGGRGDLQHSSIVCVHLCSHTTLTALLPLHLSNLQRHREQAGVQQERWCLLGTTGVCQLSGTRSGSPHSLPQPERKIGHSSHQPTGHTLHPAVPQVHRKNTPLQTPTAELWYKSLFVCVSLCVCLNFYSCTHTPTSILAK